MKNGEHKQMIEPLTSGTVIEQTKGGIPTEAKHEPPSEENPDAKKRYIVVCSIILIVLAIYLWTRDIHVLAALGVILPALTYNVPKQ
jgi:hypothetical protein